MPDNDRNIYKIARRAAGYTQETAAEMLGISDTSIRAYENGLRFPPNEVVEAMCDCYDAQRLAYQHLHTTNALARRVLPNLEQRSLLELAVRIYNRMERFTREHRAERLLEIVDDGKVTEDEKDDLAAVMTELQEIIQTGMELQIYCGDQREEDPHD